MNSQKGRSHRCPGSPLMLSESQSKRMSVPSLATISGHRAHQTMPKGSVPQKLIGCMDSHNTAMSWYIPVFLSFYCQIIFHCALLLPSPNNGHWDCLHDYDTAFSPWTSITNPVPYSVKHNEIKPTDNYTHSCLPHQMRDVYVS